jgi:hypothetical protein
MVTGTQGFPRLLQAAFRKGAQDCGVIRQLRVEPPDVIEARVRQYVPNEHLADLTI